MPKKNPIRYWEAPEVREIAESLLDFHPHLRGETVMYIFRSEAAESKMRVVLGKARRVSGLTAYLAASGLFEDMEPQPFYLIEIAHDTWQKLTGSQRIALVDHELSHIGPDGMLAHDVEEFSPVVQRHGLWKPDLRELARSMATTPLFEQPRDLLRGATVTANGETFTIGEDVH
jgi:predicted metallopeptidase